MVSLPVGVEMRSNCDSFMSEAMLTPLPVVQRYDTSSAVYPTMHTDMSYRVVLRVIRLT